MEAEYEAMYKMMMLFLQEKQEQQKLSLQRMIHRELKWDGLLLQLQVIQTNRL